VEDALSVMEGDALCVRLNTTVLNVGRVRKLGHPCGTGAPCEWTERTVVTRTGRAGGRADVLSVTDWRRRRLSRRANAHMLCDSVEALAISEWIAIVVANIHSCG